MENDNRNYRAAQSAFMRDKKLLENEISEFAYKIKNGLGEKIKDSTMSNEKKSDSKIINFIKQLFNTCQ